MVPVSSLVSEAGYGNVATSLGQLRRGRDGESSSDVENGLANIRDLSPSTNKKAYKPPKVTISLRALCETMLSGSALLINSPILGPTWKYEIRRERCWILIGLLIPFHRWRIAAPCGLCNVKCRLNGCLEAGVMKFSCLGHTVLYSS